MLQFCIKILLPILFITSCSSSTDKVLTTGKMHEGMNNPEMYTTISESSFVKKGQGIIVLSVTAKNRYFKANSEQTKSKKLFGNIKRLSKNTLIPKISRFQMSWVKEDQSLASVFESDWFQISGGKADDSMRSMTGIKSNIGDKEYMAFAVEEGLYNLLNIETFNSYVLFTGNNNWTVRGHFVEKLASFNIKRGEVLYLGDLDVFYDNINIDRTANNKKLKIEVKNNFKEAKRYLKDYYPTLSKKLKTRFIKGGIVINNY